VFVFVQVTSVKSRMAEEKECAIAVEEKLNLQYKMVSFFLQINSLKT
jgi:hypothetical protein